jgi:hypothetical protein
MATLHEINAAMTGFPRTLTWGNFRPVQNSPSPPHAAQMGASFAMGGWSVQLVNGVYKVRGARVTVAVNAAASWATPTARTSADLLRHEQGHYDITGLIARDLIRKVLDLSFHREVIACVQGSGNTASDHLRYVTRLYQADVTRFGQEARALLARLNTDPATHADGLYDVQTNHSLNAAGQRAWNDRIQRAKGGDECFELMLKLEGVI